jgi:hypothetical protein
MSYYNQLRPKNEIPRVDCREHISSTEMGSKYRSVQVNTGGYRWIQVNTGEKNKFEALSVRHSPIDRAHPTQTRYDKPRNRPQS